MLSLLKRTFFVSLGMGIALVLLTLGPGVVASAGSIVANFDGGNASDVVDAYPGMAGDGWADGWVLGAGSINTTAYAVTDADSGYNELKTGNGNYLHAEVAADPGGTAVKGSVSRDYKDDTTAIIDWTKSYTIDFTIRIDEDAASFATYMDDADDRYTIVESIGAYNGTSGGLDTNMIIATGTTTKYDGLTSLKWAILPGNGNDGYDTSAWVGTGIDLVAGGVYDMSLTLDPEDQTWDVCISDGTTSFDSTDNYPDGFLWCRDSEEVGGFLTFGMKTMGPGGARSMSIDNIVVSQASENIPGDANKDGKVDGSDVTILAGNWQVGVGGIGGATWEMGDFNDDGAVDGSDVTILAGNWQYGVTAAAAAVPEPNAITLMLLAGLMLLSTRVCSAMKVK